MKRPILWFPLIAFLAILAIVAVGLFKPADRAVKSAMVGKPLPAFALSPMLGSKPTVTNASFGHGQPRVLNIFASWCVPCVAEAPQLQRLTQAGIEIDGVAVRDTDAAIEDFLARNGDPYRAIGSDTQSRLQLALGSSGVPETFVIDGRGIIVAQHIGGIQPDDVPDIIDAVRRAR